MTNRTLRALALLPAAAATVLLAAGCGSAEAGPRITPAAVGTPVSAGGAQNPGIQHPDIQDPATRSAPVQDPNHAAEPRRATAVQAPPRPTPAGPEPGLEAAADGLRPFLLTPAEIGPGFTAGDEPRPDPDAPAVCGGPGVVARFPYAVRVGTAAERPDGRVQETVSVYGDEATAAEAYRASVEGMDCGEGSVGALPVAVAPAEDLRTDLPYDEATGWRLGGQGVDLVMISLREGEVVVNVTVLAAEDGLTALPDPLVIAQAAGQKLLG